MKKLTPILVVETIEECLPFWVDRLGFQRTLEIPEGDRLGFVMLVNGSVEVMLQSRASVRNDLPVLADDEYRSVLYVEVEELEPVEAALEGVEQVFPRRETFYGSTEIGVRDPAGNAITFAQFQRSEDA